MSDRIEVDGLFYLVSEIKKKCHPVPEYGPIRAGDRFLIGSREYIVACVNPEPAYLLICLVDGNRWCDELSHHGDHGVTLDMFNGADIVPVPKGDSK